MSEEVIEFEEKKENALVAFLIGIWDKIKYYFSQSAPYFVRVIHALIFETVKIIKSFFKYAIKQIKSGD